MIPKKPFNNRVWNYLSSTLQEFKVMLLGYRSYTALISQTGTDAPVATVLENTLGNIVWTYDAVGNYIGTIDGYSFDYTRTVYFTGYNQDNAGNPTPVISLQVGSSIYIVTTTIQNDGTGTVSDDILNSLPIEIRVYN